MKQRIWSTTTRTFQSLKVRNYRLYFIGQAVSLSGTWMQTVAQAWLVLKLTNSGSALGFTIALQFTPVLLFGVWGGVVVDRFDKRKLLMVTQTLSGLTALVLAVLTLTGVVELWMVYALAVLLGCATAVDNPARQAFVSEMVGREHLSNAVTLNSVLMNVARVIGPAFAGLCIATLGLSACFFINAGSYIAVIVALFLMTSAHLQRPERASREKGQLREGFQYVLHNAHLRISLIIMFVVGALAYEFQVSLPLVARFTFHGGSATYGLMMTCMGVGAIIGGLATASRSQASETVLVRTSLLFGLSILLVSVMPSLLLTDMALVLVGAASVMFLARATAAVQLGSAPKMTGRVMSFWSIAFLGTTPFGGPLVGWIGQNFGPRYGLLLGGLATVLAGGWGAFAYRRSHAAQRQNYDLDVMQEDVLEKESELV